MQKLGLSLQRSPGSTGAHAKYAADDGMQSIFKPLATRSTPTHLAARWGPGQHTALPACSRLVAGLSAPPWPAQHSCMGKGTNVEVPLLASKAAEGSVPHQLGMKWAQGISSLFLKQWSAYAQEDIRCAAKSSHAKRFLWRTNACLCPNSRTTGAEMACTWFATNSPQIASAGSSPMQPLCKPGSQAPTPTREPT